LFEGHRVVKHGHRWKSGIVTTAEIAKSVKIRRADVKLERNHKIQIAPAFHGTPVVLPLPPYLLGAWLGDGTSIAPDITVGVQDAEQLVSELKAECSSIDGLVGEVRLLTDRATAYKVRISRTGITGGSPDVMDRTLIARLRQLDLVGNKHIPEIYFGAGLAQRWALLQGLMDTDGTVIRHAGKTTPRCSFSNMNYQLAYGVWRLARSLGLKATLKSRHAMLYGKNCGLCWYVSFTAKASDQVFRLARKQKLLPLNKGARSGTLVVISCDSVETVPTKCISVDAPDRLFLAGHGCVPTHNSMEAACIILLHLCGPEAKSRVNSQLYSTALSRQRRWCGCIPTCVRLWQCVRPRSNWPVRDWGQCIERCRQMPGPTSVCRQRS
jgi:hypothetical protein